MINYAMDLSGLASYFDHSNRTGGLINDGGFIWPAE
jgi:hypothetical protein